MSLATQFAERFLALPIDPTFQITHDPTDPRILAQGADEVVAEIKTGAKEAATIYSLARQAATCGSIALVGREPSPPANYTKEYFEEAASRAEHLGLQVRLRISDLSSGRTYMTLLAALRYARHHAALADDGWSEVGPVLSVDRGNPLGRRLLRQFRKTAVAAAKAFGLVTTMANDEAAFRAWWQELRQRGYCDDELDVLTHPAKASAELCAELGEEREEKGTEEDRLATVGPSSQAIAGGPHAERDVQPGTARAARKKRLQRQRTIRKRGPTRPGRAEWLQAQLADRGWSLRAFHDHGGPHWVTTRRVLNGYDVTERVLGRIVKGLNAAEGFPKLTLKDIPNR